MKVVFDPSVLAQGAVKNGDSRRLLVLVAHARVLEEGGGTIRAALAAEGIRPIRTHGDRGLSPAEVAEWKKRVRPARVPDDVQLVSSKSLLDEAEAIVKDLGGKYPPLLDLARGVRLDLLVYDEPLETKSRRSRGVRRELEAVGVRATADFIVSNRLGATSTKADRRRDVHVVTRDYFIRNCLPPAVRFDRIEPSLLPQACRLLRKAYGSRPSQ